MRFNLNDTVRVKLTTRGLDIMQLQHALMFHGSRAHPFVPPRTDAEGWSTFQLWDLMSHFGGHIFHGCQMPFETDIELVLPRADGPSDTGRLPCAGTP